MEICDVVDEFGTRTGKIVTRGTKLEIGEYYRVVHIWIRDENNHYLIQQRAFHLASGPGVWATTVGYIVASEESIDGAIREVKEELNIDLLPTHLKRVDSHVLDGRVEDVWVAELPRESLATPIPGEDVADYRWVSRNELEHMVNQGSFFRYSYHGKFF
jgi:8-oxo-dGTP diphosphatase